MRIDIQKTLLLTMSAIIVTACQGGATPATGEQTAVTATSLATQSPAGTQGSPAASAPREATKLPQAANCTVVSRQPTPGPTEQSLFPPVGSADWVEGAENAAVTIIEYSDFQ